jgi:hypothetical protein
MLNISACLSVLPLPVRTTVACVPEFCSSNVFFKLKFPAALQWDREFSYINKKQFHLHVALYLVKKSALPVCPDVKLVV